MDIRLHISPPNTPQGHPDEQPEGNIVAYQAAHRQSLAEALWLAPETAGWLTPPSLCSGLGRCGRCRVLFLSPAPQPRNVEQDVLSPQELAQGWRLACVHTLEQLAAEASSAQDAPYTVEVQLPPPPLPVRRFLKKTAAHSLYLAVDVGTTSLQWYALTREGEVVAEGREINPQMGAGADVMSRLAHARHPQGRAQLATRVTLALEHICAALPVPVREICLAANSAMTCILLQKDCAGLAAAPYHCDYAGNSIEQLPNLPPVYIPPLPAPFVGGDISAGMAFLQAGQWAGHWTGQRVGQQLHYPFLLADMGTNGEFVLALSPRKAYVTSIPLGPALEGMGLTFGGVAGIAGNGGTGETGETEGTGSRVIHRFSLQATGLTPHFLEPQVLEPRALEPRLLNSHVLEKDTQEAQPSVICATGYLSLLHILLRIGLVRDDGSFYTESATSPASPPLSPPLSPLAQRVARQLHHVHGEARLALTEDKSLYLSGRDVEEILKVKAAFSLALERLLQSAQLQAADLRHIFLAGAFGEHVVPEDLEALGFLPAGAGTKICAVGNSALEGAVLLLQHPELRAPLARWSAACTVLDLTADPNFTANYMRHMRFA